jgi:hypothetical protein
MTRKDKQLLATLKKLDQQYAEALARRRRGEPAPIPPRREETRA